MKLFLSLVIFFLATSAFAQQACFDTETNVATKQIFTEDEWTTTLADWDAQEPLDPGILQLIFAWKVYNNELPTAKKFKGDKRKHCYIGCRIAQDVAFETAVYVAWYKEKEDLTDCVKGSLFEVRDYNVTLQGAELGKQSTDPQFCFTECSQLKKY